MRIYLMLNLYEKNIYKIPARLDVFSLKLLRRYITKMTKMDKTRCYRMDKDNCRYKYTAR